LIATFALTMHPRVTTLALLEPEFRCWRDASAPLTHSRLTSIKNDPTKADPMITTAGATRPETSAMNAVRQQRKLWRWRRSARAMGIARMARVANASVPAKAPGIAATK
jgi:hypothetical protein